MQGVSWDRAGMLSLSSWQGFMGGGLWEERSWQDFMGRGAHVIHGLWEERSWQDLMGRGAHVINGLMSSHVFSSFRGWPSKTRMERMIFITKGSPVLYDPSSEKT